MLKEIILSDGKPCEVRTLGLFELDGKAPEVLGAYRYSLILATGQVVEDEYNIYAWETPPKKPETPVEEIKQGTQEWDELTEYETYQAALAHEKRRLKSHEVRTETIATYILEHCLSDDDRVRIVEPEDWRKVYDAALVPQITEEAIAQCLRDTFQGVVWDLRDFAGAQASG